MLLEDDITHTSRYYDAERAIVMRRGQLITDQRRHLWHELVHSDRGDREWHTDDRVELSVDREAANRAMPLCSMEWAFGLAENWDTAAGLLKLPEPWVRWWVSVMHPAQRELVRRASVKSL